MDRNAGGSRITGVQHATGETIRCGSVVNASGPRAARTAAMASIDLPVDPRKRFTWIFTAERPLDRELPLTIEPSGIHVRQDGQASYLAGGRSDPDPPVDPEDFTVDHGLWENRVWPVLAGRIPQFEAIRVVNEWAGHYAYNDWTRMRSSGHTRRSEISCFSTVFRGMGCSSLRRWDGDCGVACLRRIPNA